jgi:hypothetical protein
MLLKIDAIVTAAVIYICALLVAGASALSEGYILCGAYAGRSTVLLDKNGDVVHTWKHDRLKDTLNGYSCYLLENGNLLRTAQVVTNKKMTGAMPWQGAINEIDPWGNLVWRYVLSNDTFTLHHDIKPLPGGNVLATSFVAQTKPQMIAAGVDTNLLRMGGNARFMLSEKIIEIKPRRPEGGDIVWQWVMFDHVVAREQAAAHPECISGAIVSALYNQTQWVHLNGLDYCPSMNLIVFTSRVFCELFVIDHGTTMLEAAGHSGGARGKGGDILYRWGKPSNYGASGGTTIDCLHCPTWIPPSYPGAGNILFFHNGPMMSLRSEVIEIKPPLENGQFQHPSGEPFGPDQPFWKYAPGDSFCSPYMSSAFRMPSGNTLCHEAYPQGNAFDSTVGSVLREITPEKKQIWKYSLKLRSGMEEGLAGAKQSYNPAKVMYYAADDARVANLLSRLKNGSVRIRPLNGTNIFPRMSFDRRTGNIEFLDAQDCAIGVYSLQGKEMVLVLPSNNGRFAVNAGFLQRGLYCVKIRSSLHGDRSGMIMVL